MEHHNCHVEAEKKELSKEAVSAKATADLNIYGMGCQNCANRVHNSLIRQEGVMDVNVNLETHSARVVYDANKSTIARLVSAVSAAGNDGHHQYSATVMA
jgi:copper chaperone CopZ